ncbi:MAG: putative quinol monooxygenase [Bacteroidota bacterium]
MIIRIVKMTFEPKKVKEFTKIFNASKKHIRNFEGCSHLELLYDSNSPHVFFTYSYWESEDDLERYRNSDLFKNTWNKTKVLFAANAVAWSLVQSEVINK